MVIIVFKSLQLMVHSLQNGVLKDRRWTISSPHGIAIDSAGNVYVADKVIIVFKNLQMVHLLQNGDKRSGNGQFDSPKV